MPLPNVFTIPASAPFLRTLVENLAAGRLVSGFEAGGNPLALADATLYLPTRRACRLAQEVFLDVLGRDAAVLPRIVPIGDVDEDEIAFADAAAGNVAAAALAQAETLAPLERQLLLAQLISGWAQASALRTAAGSPLVAGNPAAVLALADDLARLIDDMTTRGVSWDRLGQLVPPEMDPYWDLTLRFLEIARTAWPAILSDRGLIESAARRDRLIAAEQARLAELSGPVIAAGSTGSMPATAMLLAAIARLPRGAVVLPGLDTDLDETSWQMIGGGQDVPAAISHPQFSLQALLRQMQITRADVRPLSPPAPHGRERLLSEALRPAATTDRWQIQIHSDSFHSHAQHGIGTIAMVEAATAEEESLAIAVALREAVRTPGRTAALITPDRALARRVLAALGRWNVPVDDSGGDPLADNPAGVFARLALDAGMKGLEPVTLLALLKHPLFRLGAPASGHQDIVALIERETLRGPRPRAGTAGLRHALQTARRAALARSRDAAADAARETAFARADDFVATLSAALRALETAPGAAQPLRDWAQRHREAVAALLAEDLPGRASADIAALEALFEEIADSETAGRTMLGATDYIEVFYALAAARAVRRPGAPGVRVRIYGPLEARLQQADRVVLGGLVEGTWPPEAASDPWLSRPMRRDLGLDLPERRIGLSAHDFAQSLGAPEIVLTRAAKVAGAPTVVSRLVQRLAAVAGKDLWAQAIARGEVYLDWARRVDDAPAAPAFPRPEPKPPRAMRPKRLSVTEVEDWLRDPYTLYARHILRLDPLDPVDTPPGARDRGTLIHGAIQDYTVAFAAALPDDPLAEMLRLGEQRFAGLQDHDEARAFWWPRFRRIARWFVEWDRGRRNAVTRTLAEIRGSIAIPLNDGELVLRARADRIDIMPDRRAAIVDYKTGQAPTERQVRLGLSPQFTLEGAILRRGGFPGLAAGLGIAEFLYVRLRGTEQEYTPEPLTFREGTNDSQADHALSRLEQLARTFDDDAMPYSSLLHPMWSRHYGDYDHLARVKEWSATGGRDDGDAE